MYIFIGFDWVKPILQSVPVHPLSQAQEKLPGVLVQVPPLSHGLLVLHSSTSKKNRRPQLF